MIKDPQARICNRKSWNDYYLFSLESPLIASESHPGQFIMIRTGSHSYPLLRRPFSIHSKNKERIEIFFQITGVGTSLLSQKDNSETLDIIGPLGKGFTVSQELRGKEVIAVGGGRGIAPLYFLARTLRSHGASINIFYGGRTVADLPLKEKFQRDGFDVYFSTDDGSFGYKGLISDLFEQELKNKHKDSNQANYPFVGNWQGNGTDSDGNQFTFFAKVSHLGDNNYRLLILNELDTLEEPLHIMDGVLENNKFSYTADEGLYDGGGTLSKDLFEGYYKGSVDGTYKMWRIKE